LRFVKSITWDMTKPTENGRFAVIHEDPFEYDGPVAEMKKGRPQTTEAAQGANDTANRENAIASTDRQAQMAYKAKADPFAASLLPGANGALSPYAAAQLGQQKRNIGKTYGDIAQVGLKGLAARGMGSAPTGMQASLINTAGRNAGEANTNAYEDAQKNTLNQGLAGLQYSQGQQQLYDPTKSLATSIQARNVAANAGKLRNGMGSGLGDLGAGLGAFAGFA
jgi:hypothetical protein